MATATLTTLYVCQQCGAETAKWQGRCYSCGAWNSLVEVSRTKKERQVAAQTHLVSQAEPIRLDQVNTEKVARLSTGFEELDRVLGGGIVPGSVVLIGGEPGIGKSTLLLQTILNTGGIYVTAEESAHQVKLRAERLNLPLDKTTLIATSNIDRALSSIQAADPAPPLVIIDSIQTVSTDDLDGVPGSIGQVRESAHRIVALAKQNHIPIFVVSHVTKEGSIAGPKVLEHVVDTVLYLEGEEFGMTRMVRGIKNRFGAVHEVGLFELAENGLTEIADSSQLFSSVGGQASGSVITVAMEGIRPMLVEVQALTTTTSFGLPRRTANGIDLNRLLMLIAVLTKRTKLNLSNQDIYSNIAGGMKVRETALDLPVCLAIASSMMDKPLPDGSIAFGEVSLSGEIKPALGQTKRIAQAKKLGYKRFITSEKVKTIGQALAVAFDQ